MVRKRAVRPWKHPLNFPSDIGDQSLLGGRRSGVKMLSPCVDAEPARMLFRNGRCAAVSLSLLPGSVAEPVSTAELKDDVRDHHLRSLEPTWPHSCRVHRPLPAHVHFQHRSYGVSVTTLEEVFLKVASGTADNAHRDMADLNGQANAVRRASSQSSVVPAGHTGEVGKESPKTHVFPRSLFIRRKPGTLME